MSLSSSLYSGVSGMSSNTVAMTLIGNNIANANTVGYKSGRANFTDIISQSLSGSSVLAQIGRGSQVGSITFSQTQGSLESTESVTDLALEGDGFFIVSDGLTTYYTRAGQFDFDKDKNLVNVEGFVVQGWDVDANGNPTGSIKDINFAAVSANPQATSEINLNVNLDSRSPISGFVFTTGTNDQIVFNEGGANITLSLTTDGGLISGRAYTGDQVAAAIKLALETRNTTADVYNVSWDDSTRRFTVENVSTNTTDINILWTDAGSTAASRLGYTADDALTVGTSGTSDNSTVGQFASSDPGGTSNFSTGITVYDSLGNPHTVVIYFTRVQGTSWEWNAVVDGSEITGGTAGLPEIEASGTLSFNSDGSLNLSATTSSDFDFTGGATQDQGIAFDFTGSTSFGSESVANFLDQDGFAAGALQSITIDQSGLITGLLTNGQSKPLANIAVARFQNPNGLTKVGNNMLAESFVSGQPVVSKGGVGGAATIQSLALEQSNVDLAQEFVKMIVTQRAFQASSRTISVTDEMMSEIINLKR